MGRAAFGIEPPREFIQNQNTKQDVNFIISTGAEFMIFIYIMFPFFNSMFMTRFSTVYDNVSKDILDDVTNYLIVAQGAGNLLTVLVRRPSILASSTRNKCSFYQPWIGFGISTVSALVIIVLQSILLSREGS